MMSWSSVLELWRTGLAGHFTERGNVEEMVLLEVFRVEHSLSEKVGLYTLSVYLAGPLKSLNLKRQKGIGLHTELYNTFESTLNTELNC